MTDPRMTPLVWTCMICGRDRPDERISVVHKPLPGLEGRFPDTRINVRHCNDDPTCVQRAQEWKGWRGW